MRARRVSRRFAKSAFFEFPQLGGRPDQTSKAPFQDKRIKTKGVEGFWGLNGVVGGCRKGRGGGMIVLG